MRKTCLYCFLLTPLLLLAHGQETHDNKNIEPTVVKPSNHEVMQKTYESINDKYLQNIKPIFKNKCFDCHGNQLNERWYFLLPGIKQLIAHDIKEAKSHLDFSNDFPFISHDTPSNDLKALIKSAQEKNMPPLRYKLLHPSSGLNSQEIQTIQQWAQESLDKLGEVKE